MDDAFFKGPVIIRINFNPHRVLNGSSLTHLSSSQQVTLDIGVRGERQFQAEKCMDKGEA